MATITLNGTVIGLVPGEKWPIEVRPVIDGTVPASTAVVEIAFLNKSHTNVRLNATSPLSPSNGSTYVLTWDPTLSFSDGNVGGWKGEVPAEDTARILRDPSNKNSRIILGTELHLYTAVDGQTVRDSHEIPILRGIGSISASPDVGNPTLSSADFDLSSSTSLIGRLL